MALAARKQVGLSDPLLVGSDDGGACDPTERSTLDRTPSITVAVRLPWMKTVLFAGFCWDLARSSLLFLGPYYVNDKTQDATLTGLTGAASWAFLFIGPCVGYISDRVDRRCLCRSYMSVMAVSTCVVAWALRSSNAGWEVMMVFMMLISLCNVFDTTTRAPLVSDLLGAAQHEHLLGTVVGLRTVGYNVARILGNQVMGVTIQAFGTSMSMLLVSIILTLGASLVWCIPGFAKSLDKGGADATPTAVLFNRAFLSFFGVTVLANFFYWSHMPLIPVLGSALGATPWQVGLLGSASFWGGLFGSIAVTLWKPRRTGVLYCVGIASADFALAGASVQSFPAACAGLLLAGMLASLFGSVQQAMVIAMAPGASRGRAMGILTLAIAAGPFGMTAAGKTASAVGAPWALCMFGLLGGALQLIWLCAMPDALHLRN